MSKRDILDYLKENPDDWFSVHDLAVKFNLTDTSISSNCLKLKSDKWVEYKKVRDRNKARTLYKHKRK